MSQSAFSPVKICFINVAMIQDVHLLKRTFQTACIDSG